jgi:hypothetical protein
MTRCFPIGQGFAMVYFVDQTGASIWGRTIWIQWPGKEKGLPGRRLCRQRWSTAARRSVVDVGDDLVVQGLRGVSDKVQEEMASSLVCSMSMGASWCGLARRTEFGMRRCARSAVVLVLQGRREGDTRVRQSAQGRGRGGEKKWRRGSPSSVV